MIYEEWRHSLSIVDPGTRCKGMSASCLSPHPERACCTYCVGGWVGPRASLYAVEKKKIFLAPARNHPGYVVLPLYYVDLAV
jgi:hypothetical protein